MKGSNNSRNKHFKLLLCRFYAILNVDAKPLKTFPGLTRNANEFNKFLAKLRNRIREFKYEKNRADETVLALDNRCVFIERRRSNAQFVNSGD